MTENNGTYGWDCVPNNISVPYIEKCRLFSSDDKEFKRFRQDPTYQNILEGSARIIGDLNLDRILKEYPKDVEYILSNLSRFKENDIYGTPTIRNYDRFGDMAPATVKYICSAMDIKSIVGDFIPKSIVEIGGGFGALCKTLSVLYDFNRYILIDLPDVISLCRKYLNHFDEIKEKITYFTTEEFENIYQIDGIDLFIADSSLAECNRETQDKYIDRILMGSKFGYITYNTLHLDNSKLDYAYVCEKMSKVFNIRTVEYSGVVFMFLKRK